MRDSKAGQVEPLLAAPSGVSWQDSKGTYQVSCSAALENLNPAAFTAVSVAVNTTWTGDALEQDG